MLNQTKICLSAASLILVTVLTGCGKKQDPMFLAQNALADHGKAQTIKEAFGHYRYFRSAGWNRAGAADGTDIVVAATLNFKRMLSEIKDRARTEPDRERFAKYEAQYEQYLTPVSYTHLRAHETDSYLVCRLLLEK